MKPLLALTLAVALGALSAPDASAQQNRRYGYESRIDTTFAFDKTGSVNLNAANGDIVVTGWSRSEIRVRASSDGDNIRFSGSPSRVTLESAGSRRSNDIRFEVTVPFGVRVSAQTQSGDIHVRGTRGAVDAHAQNGDIDIDEVQTRLDVVSLNGDVIARNIAGDCTVNSMNGDVSLSDVRGTVDVVTVSGDIDLLGVTGKIVRGKTTSGDVTFQGAIDAAGRYDFVSHSGDVELRIPREASAQLTVSTWSGTVESDFPIVLRPGQQDIGITKSKRYVFEIGGGGARIGVEAFSGDITISARAARGGGDR